MCDGALCEGGGTGGEGTNRWLSLETILSTSASSFGACGEGEGMGK